MDIRLSFPPIPVTDARDVWDWLVVWCNISGPVLALAAIVLSVLIAAFTIRRNDRALARDRRNAFELDALVRSIEVCAYSQPGSVQLLQALLGVLPEEDLPGIRLEVKYGRVPSNDALTPFMAEYFEAVKRRLKDR